MKKIINQPDNYIKEMLEGIYIAHKDDLACVDGDLQVLVSKHKKEGKVGIVTGGGSGHLPLFLGYVGKGMIDGYSHFCNSSGGKKYGSSPCPAQSAL